MNKIIMQITLAAVALMLGQQADATATAAEAAELNASLTPMGAEKAGNKDGTIPAWTGGLTTVPAGFKSGGRRPDPFAAEKPLFSINSKNMDQYADKLTEGTKAMLKKYPASYRIDVYPTHRTAAAPKYVYENTFKNATRAKLVDGPAGPMVEGAYGGIPFPIPKSGEEVMLNTVLRFKTLTFHRQVSSYLLTSDGKWINSLRAANEEQYPYYDKDGSLEKFNGEYSLVRSIDSGPPIRAGEAIVARNNVNEQKSAAWVYLTGQRRTRKIPNSCCDTPTPFSAGVVGFDEIDVFSGRLDRFDWKLVGKKEVYVPYNTNKMLQSKKDSDNLGVAHLNPDNVRFELHRVWVVDATLRPGQRHPAVKSRYYIDEDTWSALLAERYDANGQLWRVPFSLLVTMPEAPVVMDITWGAYDLISGNSYISGLVNEFDEQVAFPARYPDTMFTPAGLTESTR